MQTPAIQTKGLTRAYGDFVAVADLTLTVSQGEVFGFLGHNGAGKTTTISMLTTLLLPTDGEAQVLGNDVFRDNLAVRQHIGYVPEQVRLYNDLTVAENLSYFAALSGVTDIPQRIQEVLTLLGHPEWRDLRVGGLSKGMRKRIGNGRIAPPITSCQTIFHHRPRQRITADCIQQLHQRIGSVVKVLVQ